MFLGKLLSVLSFYFQSIFPYPCNTRDSLFCHSLSFDWFILIHAQHFQIVPVIVHAGENITDLPRGIDKFLIKQMNRIYVLLLCLNGMILVLYLQILGCL